MKNQNLSINQENKIIRLLDGMHYAFMLLDYNQKSLYDACLSIKKDKANIIHALSHCWQIIDMTHRIREMSQTIPTLSKKDKHVRIFLDNTKLAENFRHYIQHLRGELSKEKYGGFPVFGSLSWVDNDDSTKCHVGIIGSQLTGIRNSWLVYDCQSKKFVSRVALSLGDESYGFDLIYDAILKFKTFILKYLVEKSKLQKIDEDSIKIFTCQALEKPLDT